MVLFTRLTFNENDWVVPSGHVWKASNQKKSNIPYENQYGFGHEEWLFNLRYNLDGWQYGYIRGLKMVHSNIDKVYLYSVKKEANQRLVYYIGFLNNVEILGDDWDEKYPEVKELFNDYFDLTFDEVQQTNGDTNGLYLDPFIPVIRFRIDESEMLDEPLLLNNFPLLKYKRFQPYQITDEVLKIFQNIQNTEEEEFKFNPGKANQSERYKRYTNASSKSIIKKHSEIVDNLEIYLNPIYSLSKRNLSIEKTKFQGNIADVVTLELNNSMSIYEVKTNINLRKNIREAIAQLLDYASHCGSTNINKLIIVSPCKLNSQGKVFLKRLNELITYKIQYLYYNEGEMPVFVDYNDFKN